MINLLEYFKVDSDKLCKVRKGEFKSLNGSI